MGEDSKWIEGRNGFLVAAAAVLVAVLLVYLRTLGYDFHFDDKHTIYENNTIRSLYNFWPPSGLRYIGNLSFAMNYAIGGNNVFGYHVVNILIHVINGILVWRLALLLFDTPTLSGAPNRSRAREYCIALTAALFFAVQPLNTQAVTYIAQRFASLATLFYLGAAVCYLKYAVTRGAAIGPFGSGRVYYVVAVIFAILAVNVKEVSFTLPFMLVFLELAFFPAREMLRANKLLAFLPFFFAAALIPLSFVRSVDAISVLPGAAAPTVGDIIGGLANVPAETKDISRHDYLVTQFRVVVTYMRLLVFPINQNLDYDYPIATRFFSAPVVLSLLFLMFVAAAAVFAYFKSKSRGGYAGVLLGFGAAWFFVTLSVESSVIPIRDVIYEHRMYLPLAGVSIAVSAVFYRVFCRVLGLSPLRTVFIVSVIAVLPYAAAAYVRNGVWKDEITLWQDVVKKSPDKARGYNNLAVAYQLAGRYEDALVQYKSAIAKDPEIVELYNNIGLTYVALKRYDEAEANYKESIRRSTRFYEPYTNLGRLYGSLGRYGEAELYLKEALRIKPDHAKAFYGLGEVYMEQGYLDKAAKEFRAAIRLDSGNLSARVALANLYLATGEFSLAVEQFVELEKLDYRTPDLYYNLGVAYLRMGKKKEAVAEFEKVLKLDPSDTGARRMLDAVVKGL
ncbi:MAG: tetratricopeptide repeat protein [Deltaproteobacteria bacterium]|nr:tetratricopeptide repeat protein [Deltaproteobacteria bacterium]